MSVWIRRGGVDWEVDEGTAEEKHLLKTGGEVIPAPGKPPAAKPRSRKAAAKTDDDDEGSTLE